MNRKVILTVLTLISLMFISGCFNVDRDATSKSSLNDAITAATNLYNSKNVGTAIGNVSDAAKLNYSIAITKAKAVADDRDTTSEAADKAVADLKTATTTFNSSILTKGNPEVLNASITTANTLNEKTTKRLVF